MKVKGVGVKAIPEFIKKYHEYLYETWLDNLPEKSREIYSNPIFATQLYDIYDSYTVPTQVLADLLVVQPEDLAKEIGRYAAEVALKGVYSIFIKILHLKNVVNRVPRIFKSYYEPAHVEILHYIPGEIKIKFGYTAENENLLYYRNVGWIEEFLVRGYHPRKLDINLEINKDSENEQNYFAVFNIKWQL